MRSGITGIAVLAVAVSSAAAYDQVFSTRDLEDEYLSALMVREADAEDLAYTGDLDTETILAIREADADAEAKIHLGRFFKGIGGKLKHTVGAVTGLGGGGGSGGSPSQQMMQGALQGRSYDDEFENFIYAREAGAYLDDNLIYAREADAEASLSALKRMGGRAMSKLKGHKGHRGGRRKGHKGRRGRRHRHRHGHGHHKSHPSAPPAGPESAPPSPEQGMAQPGAEGQMDPAGAMGAPGGEAAGGQMPGMPGGQEGAGEAPPQMQARSFDDDEWDNILYARFADGDDYYYY